MNNVDVVAGWLERQADGCLVLEGSLDRQQAEETVRTLLANIITAQEEQRRRIARELDDETAQTLASVLLGLQSVETATDLSTVRRVVGVLRASVSGVLRGIHRIAFGLRPDILDELGLERALEQLAVASSRRGGLSVDLDLRGAPKRRLAAPIEIALYRITQDALSDASTHAFAKTVSVLVYRNDEAVHLVIEDDGLGFQVAVPPFERQLGLMEMRERARGLDGSMTVHSSMGRGTTICVSVPLRCLS